MKIIIYVCRLTCAYWLPFLRAYGYDIGCKMGFVFGFSVGMVLVEPVGYTLGYSIHILIGLVLGNSFVTCEVYFIGFLLYTLVGFIIGTGELSLVWLHLNLQNMEMRFLARFWAHLLGCVLVLNISGVFVSSNASWIAVQLISWGWVFISSLHMDILSHII